LTVGSENSARIEYFRTGVRTDVEISGEIHCYKNQHFFRDAVKKPHC